MCKFFRKNKVLSVCFIIALITCIVYVSIYNNESAVNNNKWFNFLFQLSIGFIVNFFFYITQIYIPQYKHDREVNKCVSIRVDGIVRHMREIFNALATRYMDEYEEGLMTREYCLELLRKINPEERVKILNSGRLYSTRPNEESYFTVKEWIISRIELVENDADKLMKYYTPYITAELMKVIEEILQSPMHQNLAKSLLHLHVGISFSDSKDDIFLQPYFALMKDLEIMGKQYRN